MEAGNWIAVYAAVVGTAGVSWQVYAWWRRGRPRATLKIEHYSIFSATGEESGLVVVVTNRGDHKINVTAAGLYSQDKSGRWSHFGQATGSIPGYVDAHDQGSLRIPRQHFLGGGFDPKRCEGPCDAGHRPDSQKQAVCLGPGRIRRVKQEARPGFISDS